MNLNKIDTPTLIKSIKYMEKHYNPDRIIVKIYKSELSYRKQKQRKEKIKKLKDE